ncbi:hypothetical protein ABBQ32_011077 [Trebouxia sp. C0010 RCD-2024]
MCRPGDPDLFTRLQEAGLVKTTKLTIARALSGGRGRHSSRNNQSPAHAAPQVISGHTDLPDYATSANMPEPLHSHPGVTSHSPAASTALPCSEAAHAAAGVQDRRNHTFRAWSCDAFQVPEDTAFTGHGLCCKCSYQADSPRLRSGQADRTPGARHPVSSKQPSWLPCKGSISHPLQLYALYLQLQLVLVLCLCGGCL